MKLALLLPLLALAGCGQTYLRKEPTDTTPSISFCTSTEALYSHLGGDTIIPAGQECHGCYRRDENAIYLLTESADSLTVDEALALMHECIHVSDLRFHGNAWAFLKAMGKNQHPAGKETP